MGPPLPRLSATGGVRFHRTEAISEGKTSRCCSFRPRKPSFRATSADIFYGGMHFKKTARKTKEKIEKHQHFRTLGICSCLASAAPLQEMSGEQLRLARNSAACPTIVRHSIFSIFFCEHLRSILKKSRCASSFWDQFNVFAGRDFCIGPRPAAVFRRAHMQAQAAAARGSRRAGLQQRSEPSPYVASVVQTPPQHFQKKTQEPFSISFSCSPAGIFVSSTAARGGRRTGL